MWSQTLLEIKTKVFQICHSIVYHKLRLTIFVNKLEQITTDKKNYRESITSSTAH